MTPNDTVVYLTRYMYRRDGGLLNYRQPLNVFYLVVLMEMLQVSAIHAHLVCSVHRCVTDPPA